MNIERGISMRELKRIWEQHGGVVVSRNRTGEVSFFNPRTRQRSSLHNDRRKDAPLKLVSFVRKQLDAARD